MGLGAGQCGLVLIALDRVQYHLRFPQFATFGQATGVQDQCLGIAVVFTQQGLQQRFCFGETAFGEQRLGLLQRRCLRCGRHLHVRLEHGADRRFRLGTGKAVHRLAVLEQHNGRQAANAELGDHLLFHVAVDLGQQQFALVALGDLRQQGHQCLAWRTPLGPEIHQHRFVEGVLDHQLLEGGIGSVENVRRVLAHCASRKLVNTTTIRCRGWRGTG